LFIVNKWAGLWVVIGVVVVGDMILGFEVHTHMHKKKITPLVLDGFRRIEKKDSSVTAARLWLEFIYASTQCIPNPTKHIKGKRMLQNPGANVTCSGSAAHTHLHTLEQCLPLQFFNSNFASMLACVTHLTKKFSTMLHIFLQVYYRILELATLLSCSAHMIKRFSWACLYE